MYASFQATEKLSFNARGEYLWQSTGRNSSVPINGPSKIFALTGTVQYDLWKNVLSRLEVRWDHQAGDIHGGNTAAYGGDLSSTGESSVPTLHNAWLVAANIIYKF